MADLYTQYDINSRMSLIGCYIGNYAHWIVKNESRGHKADCEVEKLLLLIELSNIISCYEVLENEEDINCCITELELDTIFETIQNLTGLCFAPKGAVEPGFFPECFISLETNLNDNILLEDGGGLLQEKCYE